MKATLSQFKVALELIERNATQADGHRLSRDEVCEAASINSTMYRTIADGTSKLWEQAQAKGIPHEPSKLYYPQQKGLTKALRRILEGVLMRAKLKQLDKKAIALEQDRIDLILAEIDKCPERLRNKVAYEFIKNLPPIWHYKEIERIHKTWEAEQRILDKYRAIDRKDYDAQWKRNKRERVRKAKAEVEKMETKAKKKAERKGQRTK